MPGVAGPHTMARFSGVGLLHLLEISLCDRVVFDLMPYKRRVECVVLGKTLNVSFADDWAAPQFLSKKRGGGKKLSSKRSTLALYPRV